MRIFSGYSLVGRLLLVGFLLISATAFAGNPWVRKVYIGGTTGGANPAEAGVTGMKVGLKLTLYYTYVANPNPESGTTFQWYTYTSELGTGKTAIAGATASTFTLTAAQQGLFISVEVKPRDNLGNVGNIREFRAFDATHVNSVLASGATCGKAGGGTISQGNFIDQTNPLCSPRATTWQVFYTGIDWAGNPGAINRPRIYINWGDGGGYIKYTPTLQNALVTLSDTLNLTNMANQTWITTQAHTYDYAGGSSPSTQTSKCTYLLLSSWGLDATNCSGFGTQSQPFTVWDKEDNTALGAIDVNHTPGTGGVETGEETDICQGDQTPIKVQDNSTFNCTNPLETIQVNNEARWVQWVYGTASTVTTGPGATEKIVINGHSYTSAQLPVYGKVTYQAGPTTAPLPSVTDNIIMPTSANANETFVVTMRSWNTCNKLDRVVSDGNGFNPPQGAPFNVYDITNSTSGVGSNLPELQPQFGFGPPIYANSSPVTRTYTIKIITKPPTPIANNKEFCAGTILNPPNVVCGSITGANQNISWELTAASVAGSTTISWYFGGAPGTGTFVTNTYSNNCRFFRTGALTTGAAQNAMRTAMQAGTTGEYSMWAVYTTANGCTSDPVEAKLTIKPALSVPAAPTGATSVCNGSLNVAYTEGSAAPTMTIPINTISNTSAINYSTQYVWSVSGAGVTVDPPGNTQSVTIDFGIAPEPNPSTSRNVQTLLQYTDGTCSTGNSSLPVTVYGISDGGSISPNKTICDAASTGNMTLSGQRGGVLQWERSFNAGPFVAIAGTTGLTTFSEVPPNGPGTYKYRVTVQNQNVAGPCTSATTIVANQNTITVNPIPPKPTISASGATTFCLGGSVALTSSNVGGLAASYIWYKNGVATGQTTSSIILNTVAQSGNYTVEVVGAAPSNCTSPTSNATTVTINPLPTAPNPTGGGSVCSGNPAPDIVWSGLTGTAPFNVTYTDGVSTFGPFVDASNTFTISGPTTAGTYHITVLTDANGCSGTSLGGNATVTIGGSAPTFDTAPSLSPTTACDLGAATTDPQLLFSLDDAGSANKVGMILNYKIGASSVRNKTFNTNATGDPTAAITFTDAELNTSVGSPFTITIVSIISPLGCQSVFNTPLTYTVRALPTISVQPVAATTCSTNNASFTVTAAGTNLSYQWQEKVGAGAFTDITNGGVYSGATTATLTLTGATTAMNGNQYRVNVTGYNPPSTAPTCPVTSNSATLTVNPLPTVTNQTPTVCSDAGGGTTATVDLTTLQVLIDGTAGRSFTWYTGYTVATKTFTGLIATPTAYVVTGGTPVFCEVKINATGCVAPATATYTVNPKATITLQPAASTICVGDNTTFSVTAAGPGITYKWQENGVNITDGTFGGVTYSNSATATLTIQNATAALNGKTYRVVTTTTGSCALNSSSATLTVNPLPTVVNQTPSVCSTVPGGNQSVVNLTSLNTAINAGAGSTVTITWWQAYNPGTKVFTFPITPGSAPGQDQQYTVTNAEQLFAKVVTNATGCTNVATATYTVKPEPFDNSIKDGSGTTIATVATSPADFNICASGSSILFQADDAINPGSSFSWSVPPPSYPGEFTVITASANILVMKFPNPTEAPAASLYNSGIPITMTETLNGCAGNAVTMKVHVLAAPAAPVISGPTVVCENGTATYSVPFVAGSTYSWSLPPGATITSLPVTANSIDVQMSSFSGNVSVVSSNGVCLSPPASPLSVTVQTRPVLTKTVNPVCSGSNVSTQVTLGAILPGTTFNWKIVSISGTLSGVNVGDFANGVLSINQIPINTSGINASISYEVTPVGPAPGNCAGSPVTFSVTVNPEPVLSLLGKTICSDEHAQYEIKLSPANLPAGTTFNWAAPTMSDASSQGTSSGGFIPMGPAGTIHINDAFTNTSTSDITATYTIDAVSGSGCTSNQIPSDRQVVLTIHPKPVGGADTKQICSGDNVAYDLSTNIISLGNGLTSGTTYSWAAASNGNITGESTTPKSGATITDVLLNTTIGDEIVSYTVTPTSSSSCAGTPFTVNVTVHPAPAIPAQSTTICSGDPFTVAPTNGIPTAATIVPAATTYTWTAPTITPTAGSLTGASAQAVGQPSISQILTNTTNIVQTATYTVTPTSGAAGNCVGPTFTITVQVDPKPEIPNQTATICSGGTFTVTPADGNPTAATIVPASTTYTWSAPTISPTPGSLTGASAQPVGQPSVSQTLTNTTNLVQTATYTVTPKSGAAGSCVGASFTVTVEVDPKPVIPAQTSTICSGGTFTVTPTNGNPTAATIVPASTTYTWLAPTVSPTPGSLSGASAQAVGQPSISQTLTNTTNVVQTATYTVTPTSGAAGSCAGASFTVTVEVDPKPEIPNQSTTICSGGAFTVTPTNGNPTAATIVPAGTTYTWTVPTVLPTAGSLTGASAQVVGQPSISQTLTNTTNVVQTATYTVTPTSGTTGNCVGSPFTVTVQVNPMPVIPAQSVTICSGTAFAVTPTNGNPTAATIVPASTTYTWTAPTVSPTPGSLTGASAQAVGQASISQTLTNTTNVVQTATYTVTPTSGASGSCVGASFTVTVEVDPKPEIPAQTATICSGGIFTVTPANGAPTAATIVPASTTYTWTAPTITPTPGSLTGASAQVVGQPSISQTLTNKTNIVQTATYTVTPTSGAAGSCVGSSFTVTVEVDPRPEIPNQSTLICSGGTFSVAPSNGNPTPATIVPGGTTYTWTAPTVAPTAGSLTGVSAQVTPQFFISQTLTNTTNIVQTATYTVTPVSGAVGGCAGTSFTVTVEVDPAPVIPAQSTTICSGDIFTISPANGNPTSATIVPASTTYTWTAPTISPTPGSLTGASAQAVGQPSISQMLTNTTNIVQTATYTVTPTSGTTGNCVGSTFTVTVQVNPKPEIPNQAATICSGGTFAVTPSNGNPTAATIVPASTTYTWSAPTISPTAGSLTGASAQAVGQPSISQTLTNTTNIVQTATYTVTPKSGASGSCVGAPFTVTVEVDPKPVIPAQTATICSGGTFAVTPTDGNPTSATIVPASTTYTWTAPTVSPNPGSLTGASAQVVGQPSISQTLTNTTSVVQTATYTVTPTSGTTGSCTGASFTVTVEVDPKPVIPPQSTTICSGGTFAVTPADGVPTSATIVPASTTYTWTAPTVSPTPGSLTGASAQAVGQPAISQTLTNTTNIVQTATYTVTPTSGAAGNCAGATFTVTVDVDPQPVIPAQTTAICSGGTFTVTPTNGNPTAATIVPASTTYTWTAPTVSPTPGSLTGASAQATAQSSISQTLTNTTNVVQTATYTVTPKSGAAGSCVGTSFTVTVEVDPKPDIPAQSATICSGGTFTVTPANGTPTAATIVPASTTYTWTAPTITPTAGSLTGTSAQVVGQPSISQTLTNTTNITQTATYTVTPTSGTAGACVGSPFTVAIQVSPKPVIPNQSATICSGDAFSITPANGNPTPATIVPGGTTYTWPAPTITPTPGGIGGTSAQPTGQPSIGQTLTNVTGVAQTATYTVTPVSGSCTGTSFQVAILVNPQPVAEALSTIERCSSNPINFQIQDIINNVAPFTGGNGVASKFKYTVTADHPNDLSPVVFPGTFDRTVATSAPISETFSNYTSGDVTLTYTITPYSNTGTCQGTAFTLKVIYHPEPVGANFVEPVCSTTLNHDIQTQITNPAPGLPSVFTYTVSSDDAVDVPPGPNRVAKSNTPITDSYVNSSGHDVIITYTITAYNAANPSCGGVPFTYKVTISSKPVGVSSVEAAQCSDVAFSFNPQNNVNAGNGVVSTFTWTATYDSPLSGPASGSGNVGGSLHNETGGPLSVHYTVTPQSGTCTGNTFTIQVPVSPEPVMNPTLASPAAVCSNNSASSNPIGVILNTNGISIAAAQYIVALKSKDANLIGTPTTGTFPANSPSAGKSNAISADVYRNTTSTQLQVVYTITPVSASGCQGDPFDITVKVNPEPVLDNPGYPPVCSTNASNANPINVLLGTDGVSVNAAGYAVTNIQYSNGGPFGAALPAGFTVVSQAPLNTYLLSNIIKNDEYNNVSNVAVKVRYTIQARSSALCLSVPVNYDIEIDPEPIMVPGSATTCSGDAVSPALILSAAGGSAAITSYQLTQIEIVDPQLIPAGTNAGLGVYANGTFLQNDKFTNTSDHDIHVKYHIVPIAGSCKGAEQIVDVTVHPAPAVATNLNRTVCSSSASGIVLNTEVTSATAAQYEISSITVAAGLVPVTFNASTPRTTANINEISGDQFSNPTIGALTVTYSVVPITASGCRGPSKNVVLTIDALPTVIPDPEPTHCSNTMTSITLNSNTVPTAGNITFSYSVSTSSPQVTGYVPLQNNLPAGYVIQDNLVNGSDNPQTATYTITPYAASAAGGAGCAGTPLVTVVNIEPKPAMTTASSTPVCEGTGVNIALTSTTVPSSGAITFELTGVAAGPVTGTTAVGTMFNNNTTLNDVLSNPTTVEQQVKYTFLPHAAGVGCDGAPVDIVAKVNPLPNITAIADQTICSGESGQLMNVPVTVDTNPTTTLITWAVATDPGITGPSPGAGSNISQVLFNSTNAAASAHYDVQAQFIGNGITCISNPHELFDVLVNPVPGVNDISSQQICNNTAVSVPLGSNVAGSTFDWTVSSNTVGAANGSGPTINQLLSNSQVFAQTVSYSVKATAAGCTSLVPEIFQASVDATVTGQFITSDPTCVGIPLLIQFGGSYPYSAVITDGTNTFNLNNQGPVAVLNVTPTSNTSYTLTSVTDGFGCNVTPNDVIRVGVPNADFTVESAAACSPSPVDFKFNQVAGTQYTWNWIDGTDTTFTAATTVNNQIISHTFVNPAPSGEQQFPVMVSALLPQGCIDTKTQNVTVYGQAYGSVIPSATEICSGTTVTFTNQSLGASDNKWFYRRQGTTEEKSVKTTAQNSYKLTNTSSSNPITYEVVYQGDNGHCPVEVVTPIVVYRGITGDFSIGDVPFFEQGGADVTFTNTSDPKNTTQFDYSWDFGDNATPDTGNGVGAFTINYSQPGLKTIVLNVTNIQADADGLSCNSTVSKTITILVPPLVPEITYVPQSACFPADIEVTKATGTGDLYEWQLLSDEGRVTSVSTAPLPLFNVTAPGSYTISLKTTNSLTGQIAFWDNASTPVQIYPQPVATFEARPQTLFVPDTELKTFNFTTGATQYAWNFGDSQDTVFDEFEPSHFYQFEGKYTITLVASNDHGDGAVCKDTVQQEIIAREGGETKVPNAFTPSTAGPNGGTPGAGSVNDVFLPVTKGVVEFKMQIYDRWGTLIFESNDKNIGWDGYDRNGNLLPGGVYVYKLTMRLADGARTTKIGDVTLIR